MTTYNTDFSSYTTGVQPSDWTERWNTADGASTVRADAAFSGGKYLEQTKSTSSRYVLTWDAIDGDANRDDAEILAKFESDDFDGSSNFQCMLGARMSGSAGSETGYVIFTLDESTISLVRYNSGVGATLLNGSFDFSINTKYWCRFRVNGTSIKAKFWKTAEEEPPTWQIDTTDSVVTGVGWVGIGGSDIAGTRKYDFASVGTNGDTAPITLDASTTIRTTQVPVEIIGQDSSPTVRVTQAPVEVIGQDSSPTVRVTQVVVEVLQPLIDPGGTIPVFLKQYRTRRA